MDGRITFRWLGVAGIELRAGDHTLAVDPFLTRPPFVKLLFSRLEPDEVLAAEKLPLCDFILVTHAHYDHLMDVPAVVKNTGAIVLGSPSACQILEVCGVPTDNLRKIRVGDRIGLGNFHVKVLSIRHIRVPGFGSHPLKPGLKPPLRLWDYQMDEDYAFLVEAINRRILVLGGEKLDGAQEAEVLFTHCFQKRVFYERLLQQVKPSIVIPLHWENLFRPLSRPLRPLWKPSRLGFWLLRRIRLEEFEKTITQLSPHTRVLLPEIFREYPLD